MSVISSDPRGPRAAPVAMWAALVVAVSAPAGSARAQARLTQDEALRLAFPEPARIERRTAYLSAAQLDSARARAGRDVEIRQRVVTYYAAWRGDEPLGVAYFDAHRVRTLPEVVMVVVGPDDRIRRIEILRFLEPPEYEAPPSWLRQFEGESLDDGLALRRRIVNLTGATLTSRALVQAARRVLALHGVIRPFGPAGGASRDSV
jgi:hypothetical protein